MFTFVLMQLRDKEWKGQHAYTNVNELVQYLTIVIWFDIVRQNNQEKRALIYKVTIKYYI